MNNQNNETLEERVDNLEDHVDMIISDASLEERIETLEDHVHAQVNSSLFSIKALSEMTEDTEKMLSVQGFGPYQRGYMREWAQFVVHGHQKKYNLLQQQNEELRKELQSIKNVMEDLADHLKKRAH